MNDWAGSSVWHTRSGAEERPVCKAKPNKPEGRGFKSRPVHYCLSLILTHPSLVEFAFHLKREGYRPLTIESTFRGLKSLSKICDLDNPDSVKDAIASKNVTDSRKETLVERDLKTPSMTSTLEGPNQFLQDDTYRIDEGTLQIF